MDNRNQRDHALIERWIVYRNYEKDLTQEQYRRELVRFHYWCHEIAGCTFEEFSVTHVQPYLDFLRDPPSFCITSKKIRSDHPEWRPFFLKGLSRASMALSISVLKLFFRWMSAIGICSSNPFEFAVAVGGKASGERRHKETITELQWDVLYSSMTAAVKNATDKSIPVRDRWILSLLYYGELSVTELANQANTMRCFYRTADGARLMLRVSRRDGGTERDVEVCEELQRELAVYRTVMGKTSALEEDLSPLLQSTRSSSRGVSRAMTRQALHMSMRNVFATAVSFGRGLYAPDTPERRQVEQLGSLSMSSVRRGFNGAMQH